MKSFWKKSLDLAESFGRRLAAVSLALTGIVTAAGIFAFAQANYSVWNPGTAPLAAPGAGNVKTPVWGPQTCETGKFIVSADSAGQIICAAPAGPQVCNPSTIANGTVGSYPGCQISCNSGYTLQAGVCVVNPNPTCNPGTVANGTVSAYPSCQISCNSGYTLQGSVCVQNPSCSSSFVIIAETTEAQPSQRKLTLQNTSANPVTVNVTLEFYGVDIFETDEYIEPGHQAVKFTNRFISADGSTLLGEWLLTRADFVANPNVSQDLEGRVNVTKQVTLQPGVTYISTKKKEEQLTTSQYTSNLGPFQNIPKMFYSVKNISCTPYSWGDTVGYCEDANINISDSRPLCSSTAPDAQYFDGCRVAGPATRNNLRQQFSTADWNALFPLGGGDSTDVCWVERPLVSN